MLNMKVGFAISALIVLVLVGLLMVNLRSAPDLPTAATAANKLAIVGLPADLPPIQLTVQPDADATADYREAMGLFLAQPTVFSEPPFPARAVEPIVERILRAAKAGQVDRGFLDDDLKMDYQQIGVAACPAFDLGQMLLQYAYELAADPATRPQADDLARAVWVLGERAFRDNTRLANRYAGLLLIQAAGGQLFQQNDGLIDTADALFVWGEAVAKVTKPWQAKADIVRSTKPHPGDLIRVATQDKDRTFRVAATYWLGVAKFTSSGTRGNRQAILTAIASAKSSDDPLIARAGEAAESLTLEQFRQIH